MESRSANVFLCEDLVGENLMLYYSLVELDEKL